MTHSDIRIILLPGPYGFSHATRLWQLNVIFERLNYSVAVSANPKHQTLSWGHAKVYDAPEFPEMKSVNENIYDLADQDCLNRYVDAEIFAIQDFKADIVIADLRPTAQISSILLDKPLITLANVALVEDFNPFDFFELENPEKLQKQYRERVATQVAEPFRLLAKSRGVNRLKSLFDFINGDRNWICDVTSIWDLELSKKNKFIGPFIYENESSNTDALPSMFTNGLSIVLYISLGNSASFEYVDLFISAFRIDPHVSVLITTGMNQRQDRNGLIGQNIFITNYISGSDILPYADVMIHHGGSGSMYQAMKYEVPSVVLPINIEQKINALAIEKSQTGIVLDIENLTAEHLRKKVQQAYVHRSILKKNVENLSSEIKHAMNDEAFSDDILSLL